MLPYRHFERSRRSEERTKAATAHVRSRSWLAIAGALLAAGALAGPAAADVRPGNAITAFPDRDMIVVEGDYADRNLTVEVVRNGVVIGRTSGPAQSLGDAGSGLEINHGPAGRPQPGDCWTNVTPDVRGGDLIRVTDGAELDEMVVAGVTLDPAEPTEALDGSIVFGAGAVAADGSPMDLDLVTAEVRNAGADYRASGRVERDAQGAVTVTYPAPFRAGRGGGTQDQQRQYILTGDHMLTHSLGESEITIAERDAQAGPAPGCDAPLQADAVTSSDDAHVNLASGDLTLSGTARPGTTAIEGSLTDSAGSPPVSFAGALSAGDGPRTWTATIPRDELLKLADGPLVASAAYVTDDGTTQVRLTGATLEVGKDVVAPDAPASTPAPGLYASAQSVTLDHSDAEPGTTVHYTSNGSEPTASSRRATGPILVTATQTIKALAIDPAGNPSPVAVLAYRIEAPAPVVPTPATPEPAPVTVLAPLPAPTTGVVAAPVAPPVQAAPAAALKVSGLRVISRRSARTITRQGLTVAFTAPAEVTKVRVRLMRGRTVIATRTVDTPTARGYRLRMSGRELRRLAPGTYTVEAAPVSGGRASSSRMSVRVGR